MLRTEEGRWRSFVETMSRVLAATPRALADDAR
jgi:hypothetical protein